VGRGIWPTRKRGEGKTVKASMGGRTSGGGKGSKRRGGQREEGGKGALEDDSPGGRKR